MATSNPELNRVKHYRQARGWSQAELADRVGISRAGVSAIEGNRLTPSVAAALALAKALDTNVETLFSTGLEISQSTDTTWAWRPFSYPCRYWTGEVGSRLLHFPVELSAGIALGQDGITERAKAASVSSDLARRTLVVVTCDPAAGYLAAEYSRQTPFRMLVFTRPSRQALTLLDEGVIHVAGVHLADTNSRGGNGAAIVALGLSRQLSLLGVADWEEGVAMAPTLKFRTIRQTTAPKMRWVGRLAGAGARRCQDMLLGNRRPPQRTADDHRAVISAIRSGYADVGVCPRLVAEEGQVGFLPVCTEPYDLCFRTDTMDDPRVIALVQVVRSSSYRDILATLPGYRQRRLGETLRLQQSTPKKSPQH